MPTFELVSALTTADDFELGDAQKKVISSSATAIRVLGSAGTGKTTTLAHLVVAHVRNGTDPGKILVLSQDQAAAGDFAAKVAVEIGAGNQSIISHTFHSLAVKMWATHTKTENIFSTRIDKGTQVLRISQLLPESKANWPQRLREAVKTRSFARHVSDFIGRMAVLGIDEDELIKRANELGREDWKALAQFKREFDEICSLNNEIYFAQMIEDAEYFAKEYEYDLIVVDSFEEIDEAQMRILSNLVRPATKVVVASDPDQSVNAFRGSTRSATWEFDKLFADHERETVILDVNYRNKSAVALAAQAMIKRTGITGALDETSYRKYREPELASGGQVQVLTFDSTISEAEHIANIVRTAHLVEGIDYSDIAVLTRRGGEAHRMLAQAMNRFEVPARVPLEQIKLIEHSAVNHVAQAVDICAALSKGEELRPEEVITFLQGPIIDLDPSGLRRFARNLRFNAREAGELIRSDQAIVDALLNPSSAVAPHEQLEWVFEKIQIASKLVHEIVDLMKQDVDAEAILWKLWNDAGWSGRVRGQLDKPDSARIAHGDADAMVALFEAAAQSAETNRLRIETFIDELRNQEIPNNPVRPRGLATDAVTIMTAHRSKGTQFKFVVLAGVQENVWPATRAAAALLGEDQLEDGGLGLTMKALRNEERRLFYLALSRASEKVLITAVGDFESEGEDAPSRFVEEMTEIADVSSTHVNYRPNEVLSWRGIVSTLRKNGAVESAAREQSAARLAKLIEFTEAADPKTWWGLTEAIDSTVPMQNAGEPIFTSASALEKLNECPLKWFLDKKLKAGKITGHSAVFGSLVHAVAEMSAEADFSMDRVNELLDEVWNQVPYEFAGHAARERAEAQLAIERYFAWQQKQAAAGWETFGSEVKFSEELEIGGQNFKITGFIDRIEINQNGEFALIDFKTKMKAPIKKDLERHIQMGLYDIAAAKGAISGVNGPTEEHLVFLRVADEEEPSQPVDALVKKDSAAVAYEALANAAQIINEEAWRATPSTDACQYCEFKTICPAKSGSSILEGGR